MKKFLLVVLFLLFSVVTYAQSTVIITSDAGGGTVSTGSDGSTTISSDAGGGTVTTIIVGD